MYKVFFQEQNKIGIRLEGELKESEFADVLQQIKNICTAYPQVDILFDTSKVQDYKPDLVVDTYGTLHKYKGNIRKVAVLSNNGLGIYLNDLFKNFEDTDFRVFGTDEFEKAQDWALSPDPTEIYK